MASIAGRVNEQLESLARVRFLSGGEVECTVDIRNPWPALKNPQFAIRNPKSSPALALAQIEWLGQIRFAEVIVKDGFIIGTEPP